MNYPVARLPHSGLGIAATVIAVFAGLGLLACVGYAGYLGVQAGGQPSPDDPQVMAAGLGMLAAAGMLVLGGLLGIAGLFVGERRRLFAWIGLIMCFLPVAVVVVLAIVGTLMPQA